MNEATIYASLLSVAVFNLLLGLRVFFRDTKSKTGIAFLLITASVALWALAILFSWVSLGSRFIDFWSNATFWGPSILIASLFYFALVFPKEEKELTKNKIILIFAPAALVIFLALLQKINIKTHNPWTIERGFGLYVFVVYFVTYSYLALVNLYKKYKKSEKEEKAQIKYVFTGFALAIVLGSFLNLVLPIALGNARLTYLGPSVAGTIFAIFIAYSVMKHRLFNLRVIATELFAVLVVFVFFINIFSFNSGGELAFNVFLFMLTAVFAILLVRGTIREIRALEELSETKSEFLSIASHQLRTPLSILKGYLSLLREGSFGKLSSKQLEVINKAYNTNEGMRILVNDFLNLSRAEKGTLKYSFEEVDLNDFIGGIVQEFKMAAELKGLDLKYQKPEDSLLVSLDKDKFTQVVANLIDNAIKYTNEGSVLVRVVHEDKYSNIVRVYVSDTGIGLTEKEAENIFQSFKRSERGERINAGGSGLGLYVAKMITEDHRGKIWAESKGENKGTTFIIELPLANSLKNVQNKQDG